MNRFILFAIMLIAFNYLSNKKFDQRKKIRLFLIIISIPFILDSALRNLGVGQDTYQYYYIFENVKDMSFKSIFNMIKFGDKDYFYYLFQKFFQIFSLRYHVFLGFVAFLYFFSLGLYIFKSGISLIQCLIAYTFYLQFFYNFFSCTGTRQTIAVSFVTFAYLALTNKKYNLYAICTIMASLFHLSAILSLSILLVKNIKNLGLIVFLIPFALPFLFMFGSQISRFAIQDTILAERYAHYTTVASETGSLYITMVYLIIFLGMTIFYNKLAKDKMNMFNMKLFTICILLLPLIYVSNTAHRVSLFFSMSMFVLLPSIVKNIRFQGRYIITLLIILSLTFIVVRKSRSYYFYWEEMEYVNYWGDRIIAVEPLY